MPRPVTSRRHLQSSRQAGKFDRTITAVAKPRNLQESAMAVVISVIAVLVALGCFFAIMGSDWRENRKKKKESPE